MKREKRRPAAGDKKNKYSGMFRKPHFLLFPLLPSLRRYDFLSLHSDVKQVLELLWPPKKTLTAALVLCATSKKSFLPSSDRVLKETAYISISGGLADFDRKSIPQSISLSPFLFGGAQSPSFSRHFSSRPVIPWPTGPDISGSGVKKCCPACSAQLGESARALS